MRIFLTLYSSLFFFFNDTATTEIYTLSLHDALPISRCPPPRAPLSPSCAWLHRSQSYVRSPEWIAACDCPKPPPWAQRPCRSEEHTSELQSRQYLVCRLLLEKKKKK